MRCGASIVDGIVRHGDTEVVGEGIDDAAADAAGCGAAGDDQCVGAGIDQIAGERRAEERAWMFFRQQNVVVARSDLSHEVVAIARDIHNCWYLVRKPAFVETFLGRYVGIENRPIAISEQGEETRDVAHGVPAHVTTGGRELLDRLPEGFRRRADGSILHIDDQQRRARTEAGPATESGGSISALLFFGYDAIPGFRRGCHPRPPLPVMASDCTA